MRSRFGFVSNSSSSSFVLDLLQITPHQHNLIRDHLGETRVLLNRYQTEEEWEEAFPGISRREFSYFEEEGAWSVAKRSDRLCVWTWMDNFPMGEFLGLIGVPEGAILERGEYPPDWATTTEVRGED